MLSQTSIALPERFPDLAPFIHWALPTESARNAKRLGSTMPEIEMFYDEMHKHLDAIFDHLSGKSVSALNAEDRTLMNMALSLMEVSACIELFSSVRVPLATSDSQMKIEQ